VFAASLALYRLRHLAEWLNASAAGSWSRFIALEACTVFAILLLPTFLLGAAYPIALSIVAEGPARVGRSVGRVAALNTLGSILGALTSGFVLMPLIGITGGLRTLIALSLAFGVFLLASSALRRGDPVTNPARARRRVRGSLARAFGASAAAALAAMLLGGPRMGPALQALGDDERLLSYEEASPATVAVRENGMGERMLAVNGLDEVPVDVSSLLTFRMLAHLPLLLHPRPREVMVLSLGGAITTGSVSTHGVERIDAVELCRPVVKAAELFEPWNHGVLGDGRLRVIIQDGRNHLLTTDERYDVITADATHPWSADSWILYTREFYGLVKERLSEGGLFCQWVPLHWLSPEDYRCILRTMHSVFPEMSLWYTGSYTVALAGRGKLGIDPARIAERMGSPGVKADLASVGIESVGSLLGLFLMSGGGIEEFTANGALTPSALTPSASSPGAPAPGPLNTDDLAYLEHSASRCYGRETSPENLLSLLRFKQGPEAIPAAPGAVDRLGDFLKAREKLMLGRMAVYDGNFERAIRFYDYALTFAPDDGLSRMFLDDVRMTLAAQRAALGDALGKAGDTEEARRAYEEALEIDPGEPAAHHGAGLELLSRGEYLAALDHFDKAIERRSRDPALRASRAEALAALGRTGEAERERDEIKLLERGMKGYGAR
jgi:spermidine synthase